MSETPSARENVKAYYGSTLQGSEDLKTSACCCAESPLPSHRSILAQMPDEILDRFYGCGSPLPEALAGMRVLDLGCGTGRDVYLASRLVGECGSVIGVDMTPAQLEVAQRYVGTMTESYGYATPNVDFRQGEIEDLAAIGIEDASINVVISNCVLNLSPEKDRVFAEILRVLKPGGELYFSDVFADRRLPRELMNDPVLHGECLAGAMYAEDFRRLLAGLGVPDYRTVSTSPIALEDQAVKDKIGFAGFYSATVRVFKLDNLEDRCEDYGQVACYRGTLDGHPHGFSFDDHHYFETNRPMLVCGNTAAMLGQTRLAKHFAIHGDRSRHFGLFPCGPSPHHNPEPDTDKTGACC